MAHIAEENRLCLVGCFRFLQCFLKNLFLFHALTRFSVNIHKACAYRMDKMIIPVFRMSDAGKAYFFPGIPPMPVHHIPVCDDPLFLQQFLDILRLYELQEFLPVFFPDIRVGIICDGCQISEPFAGFKAVVHIAVGVIAYAFIRIEIQVIYTVVIRGQRRNQLVLFFLLLDSLGVRT